LRAADVNPFTVKRVILLLPALSHKYTTIATLVLLPLLRHAGLTPDNPIENVPLGYYKELIVIPKEIGLAKEVSPPFVPIVAIKSPQIIILYFSRTFPKYCGHRSKSLSVACFSVIVIPASANRVVQPRNELIECRCLSVIFAALKSWRSASWAGPFKGIPRHLSAISKIISF